MIGNVAVRHALRNSAVEIAHRIEVEPLAPTAVVSMAKNRPFKPALRRAEFIPQERPPATTTRALTTRFKWNTTCSPDSLGRFNVGGHFNSRANNSPLQRAISPQTS